MIGGTDIVIPVPDARSHCDDVLRLVRANWSSAIIEDAETGLPPSATTHEMLVYRDERAFVSIEADGVTDENGGGLLHVLLGVNSITCVVHGYDSVAMPIVKQIEATFVMPG